MKIAILGGGFAGISAAYYLQKKGHNVTLFEKEPVLGGLAVGFKQSNWEWPLERAYHHLFATDESILRLAEETGYKGIFFKTPETSALYQVDSRYKTFPIDTPQDLLKLPILPFIDKLRAGIIVLCLKFSPPFKFFHTHEAEQLFSFLMGEKAWNILLGGLLRKKFGKYAGNILASFIWARMKVRTKSLGYSEGGFQTFIEHLEKTILTLGVEIKKEHEVKNIEKKGKLFTIKYLNSKGKSQKDEYEVVISTLPIPIMNRVTETLFKPIFIERFNKLKYLHAVVLIIESKKAILDKTYWLSICPPEIPLMFVGQHTNFIDKKHYGGNNIAYVARYVTQDDPLWTMNEKEIVTFVTPELEKINPKFDLKKAKTYLFKAPFAQPVFDKDFLNNKPDFETPVHNFYIANLDMTYPNDRGTNYAVKIGKEVSEKIG